MPRRKGPSKYVGSCGMYLVAIEPSDQSVWLLVHRRSTQVSESNTIAAPGGIVERPSCLIDGGPDIDFEAGARKTAVQELLEETGIELDAGQVEGLERLPTGEGTWWGEHLHRNFCARLDYFPEVQGPEKASVHEIKKGGMAGIGEDAGDGFHAWVEVTELLRRDDLMPGCRAPIAHIAAGRLGDALAAAPEACDAAAEPARKRPRGSIRLDI
mmetsp:Transcript_54135/g.150187  ORF Transcript_54135/g.150187 Transcript_54135/m.150187 type:complete len:213 (+) Transcript_54135:136-774(+)